MLVFCGQKITSHTKELEQRIIGPEDNFEPSKGKKKPKGWTIKLFPRRVKESLSPFSPEIDPHPPS